MQNILVIDSSPPGEHSVSRKLTRAISEQITQTFFDVSICHRDLVLAPLKPLSALQIRYFLSEPLEASTIDAQVMKDSDSAINELLLADTICDGRAALAIPVAECFKILVRIRLSTWKNFHPYSLRNPRASHR